MSARRPNLFDYGHKELSQDAVICWLLDWANERYRNVDPVLHDAGLRFVRALFAKHCRDAPERIHDVQLGMQVSSIDVLAWINNEYAILIEDKTESGEHGDQLRNYHKKVLDGVIVAGNKVKPARDNLLPVFLKTGNMSSADRRDVERQSLCPPYRVFDRSDLLNVLDIDVLDIDGNSSEILGDFRSRLDRMEEKSRSYTQHPPRKWSWEGWEGFFVGLEDELQEKEAGWGYVPNQAGGFLGFWSDYVGKKAYLQIEARPWTETENGFAKLCFKIEEPCKEKRSRVRQEWYEAVIDAGKKHELPVTKPPRFGVGNTMTVAVYGDSDVDCRLPMAGDHLDLVATKEVLRKAERVLASAAQAIET